MVRIPFLWGYFSTNIAGISGHNCGFMDLTQIFTKNSIQQRVVVATFPGSILWVGLRLGLDAKVAIATGHEETKEVRWPINHKP